MKKLIAIGLAAMAAVVLASSAQAASCSMKKNSSDDGSFKCKVNSERKLEIKTNADATVTTTTTASSNVGSNSISAGEDVNGATIGGGNTALTDIETNDDVNSLELTYEGLPDPSTPSVDISSNDGDDPEYKADVKEKSKEKVDDKSNATVNATETLSSNGGANSISATDDVNGATIGGGTTATTKSKTTRFVNFRTITRN